jgi:threonine/homoserine/homoserine lactone efflux protein
MTLSTWWLFIVMTFVVSATPGPNMLYVMSLSARHGVRTAVAAMAGCMTALLAMMSLSAAGLGALLQSFPAVFDALRLAGAAYLAYLGIKCWRTPVHELVAEPLAEDGGGGGDATQANPATVRAPVPTPSRWAIYRQGFLVAASNPKAILFAAAFFPQFISPGEAKLPQFAILLTTFTVIEVGWYFVYAVSGKRLSAYLQRAKVMRAFNRATGGVFVGFAALMAVARS